MDKSNARGGAMKMDSGRTESEVKRCVTDFASLVKAPSHFYDWGVCKLASEHSNRSHTVAKMPHINNATAA